MRERREHLVGKAAVKGTMVTAHLAWAQDALRTDPAPRLAGRLSPEAAAVVSHAVLATDWVKLKVLCEIDSALAALVGGAPEETLRRMGRHSAEKNLAGVYRNFVEDEPHRFFEKMALLHGRFQNFGSTRYERIADRAGRISVEGYEEYSPVFCASALGYYEGALVMMKVPGPLKVAETTCQCAGDPACWFDLAW